MTTDAIKILEVEDHEQFPLMPIEEKEALIAVALDGLLRAEGYFLFGGKIFQRVVIRTLHCSTHGCTYEQGKCFYIPVADLSLIMRRLREALANRIELLARHTLEPLVY